MKKCANIQRVTFKPEAEAGGCKKIIELHGEFKPVLGWVERFYVEHSDAAHRRRLDFLNEPAEVQVFTTLPGSSKYGGQEYMFP